MKHIATLTLAILMLVASAQAKMIYGHYTASNNKNGIEKQWDSDVHGYRVTEYAVIELKYNTITNRGVIRSKNGYCEDETVILQLMDNQGLMIDAITVTVGTYFYNDMLDEYSHDWKTQRRMRSQINDINIISDCVNKEQYDEIVCNASREYNPTTDHCDRKCKEFQHYDADTDKCKKDTVYMGTESHVGWTADGKNFYNNKSLEADYQNNDYKTDGEWCQKADGEWYFDNKVKNGKCPNVNVRKDPELESAYGNEPSEKEHCPPSWQDENGNCKQGWNDVWYDRDDHAPDPWYSNVNGQWYCDHPYRHDGNGHCVM